MGTILVVEDNSSNRYLLRAVLSRAGHTVQLAESGAQCLAMCESAPPDLVLLDLMMPGLSGFETLQELRCRYDAVELPVIMMSTQEEGLSLPEAMAEGASDFVAKPVHRDILVARVANQLQLQAGARALRQAHRIQTALGEAIVDAVLIQDQSGAIRYINQGFLSHCDGHTPGSVEEAFLRFRSGALLQLFQQQLPDPNPEWSLDTEVQLAVGKGLYFQLSSHRLMVSGGEALRIWRIRDLTEERLAARRAQDLLRLETVSSFVAGVAHNFNNLLGSVSGALELLHKRSGADAQAVRLVELARKGVVAAQRFTKRMSLFAGSTFDPSSDPFERVEELVAALVLSFEVQHSPRITITLEIAENLPPVPMHPHHVAEVFSNLLNNAVDAIEGEGRIEVVVSPFPEDEKILVSIRDTGCGIPPENLRRIFEPFFSTKNLDVDHSVSMEGNGLGLWNVFNILKLVGGDIAVDSEVGKGTLVSVLLPTRESRNLAATPSGSIRAKG